MLFRCPCLCEVIFGLLDLLMAILLTLLYSIIHTRGGKQSRRVRPGYTCEAGFGSKWVVHNYKLG